MLPVMFLLSVLHMFTVVPSRVSSCNMLKMLKIIYYNISSMFQGNLCEFIAQICCQSCFCGQFYTCMFTVVHSRCCFFKNFRFCNMLFDKFTISQAWFKVISVNFLLNYVASFIFVVSFTHVHSSSHHILLFKNFSSSNA